MAFSDMGELNVENKLRKMARSRVVCRTPCQNAIITYLFTINKKRFKRPGSVKLRPGAKRRLTGSAGVTLATP